jgi:phage pi2 protein 07
VSLSTWERGDARDRLAAQKRWEQCGRTLLEPSVKEMLKRQNENQVKYPPDMDDRPDEADDYWAVRFGFLPATSLLRMPMT